MNVTGRVRVSLAATIGLLIATPGVASAQTGGNTDIGELSKRIFAERFLDYVPSPAFGYPTHSGYGSGFAGSAQYALRQLINTASVTLSITLPTGSGSTGNGSAGLPASAGSEAVGSILNGSFATKN